MAEKDPSQFDGVFRKVKRQNNKQACEDDVCSGAISVGRFYFFFLSIICFFLCVCVCTILINKGK